MVSGFHFTTDFSENVISAQKLSTKFGLVFNYHAKFFGNNFKKKSFGKIGEKLSA